AGCAGPRAGTSVTMDCRAMGMAQVTNSTTRVQVPSGGYSLVPPQGGRWCLRTPEPGAIAFNTHPLLGEPLHARPSDAEILHSFAVGAFLMKVPEGINVETADESLP